MKKVNLVDEDNPKSIVVGDEYNPVLKSNTFNIFMEYMNTFVWTYRDLKCIPLELCVHRILLVLGAQLVRKRLYKVNKNYLAKVQEEIEKMLEVGIIFKMETSEWVSPIVIFLKGQIKSKYVDFRCLNVVSIKDPFLILFIDTILEEVAGHEMYLLMEGFF